MTSLASRVLELGNSMFHTGEIVARVPLQARIAIRSLEELSKDADITEFFGRSIKTKVMLANDGSQILHILDSDGKQLSGSSARVIGNNLRSGKILEAIRIIEPSLEIADSAVKDYELFAANTPSGAFGILLEHVNEMRSVVDDLGPEFSRLVRSNEEMNQAVERVGGSVKQSFEKVKRLIEAGGSVGKIVATSVIGLSAYELLRLHAKRCSGCYRVELVNGKLTERCRVPQYSTKMVLEPTSKVKICTGVHKVRSGEGAKLDWSVTQQNCLRACNNDYLNLTELDQARFQYQCLNLDVWDAMGDIVGGVVGPVENLFKSTHKWLFGGLVVVGVLSLGMICQKIVFRFRTREDGTEEQEDPENEKYVIHRSNKRRRN